MKTQCFECVCPHEQKYFKLCMNWLCQIEGGDLEVCVHRLTTTLNFLVLPYTLTNLSKVVRGKQFCLFALLHVGNCQLLKLRSYFCLFFCSLCAYGFHSFLISKTILVDSDTLQIVFLILIFNFVSDWKVSGAGVVKGNWLCMSYK